MSASGRSAPLRVTRVLGHLMVMGVIAVVLGVLVAGLAVPFAGVLGLSTRNVSSSLDDLPAELKTESLPQKTKILDSKGNLIASLYDQNRVNVSLDQIAPIMTKAIVSIEDYRFYSHGALDLKGTLRAMVTNEANNGTVQGGSSITQQLVKLTLLQEAGDDKAKQKAAVADTYARKIRELRYAIALEKEHSKDWILERYLNTAYFGDGAFGVQAAARHYFNTNAKDLNLRQSAMLAGLVKNPSGYDPTNYADRALLRRNTVIARMAQLHAISQRQATKASAKPLGLDVTRVKNGCVQSPAPFFCDYVVRYLKADPQLGATVADRNKLLLGGGLTIQTTLDQSFQQAADRAVQRHVYPTDNAIGGLAMVVPGTGEVRALAQSRPMGTDVKAGQTYLNYVVPKQYGDSNGFQAGSTFKAFVLATAINQGLSLGTTFKSPDEKLMPFTDYKVCDGSPVGSGVWDVHNSTGFGTFNMYTGTALSVNTYFAQLEAKTGLCKPYKLAQAMGVRLTDPTNQMVPSFTLGVADTDPMTMASAYATFAARGTYCAPRPVTSIEDSSGKVVKTYPKQCKRLMPSPVADAVNDILTGVQAPDGFGGQAGLALDKPSAGKTGTRSDNKAVWFVGYTPALAAAAVVAGANSVGHQITLNQQVIGGSFTDSAHGSTTAGPIWGDAMHAIEDQLPDDDFVAPNSDDIKGVLIPVPSVAGLSVSAAEQRLQDAGFTTTDGGTVDSSATAGTVVSTSPAAGSQYSSGNNVTIYSSDGTPAKPKGKGGKGKGKGRGAPGAR